MSVELPTKMYVSVHEASQIVGLHRQTIEKAIARGDFATKRIAGRVMILTESLRPEPKYEVLWRHMARAVGIGDGLTVTILRFGEEIAVQVTGTMRGLPIEHTDRRRIIPADLGDKRIVLDELRVILGDALDHAQVSDASFNALVRDCAKNYSL